MLRHIESLATKRTTACAAQSPQQPPKPAVPTAPPPSPSTKAPQIKRPAIPVGVDRTEAIKGFKKAMVKSMTAALVKHLTINYLCSL